MATFDYPYRKSINITAWVLQIIVCLILLAASAYVMSIVNDDEYNQYLDGYTGLFTYVLVFPNPCLPTYLVPAAGRWME